MKWKPLKKNINITKIMFSLGCTEIRPRIFTHPDLNFEIDLTATAEDKVLLSICQKFSQVGFESCGQQIRELIGA